MSVPSWQGVNFNPLLDASPKDQFDIFNNMSRYDPDGTRERLSEGKCHGTTTWILDSPDFCRWLGRSINSCFALTGIVGSGKTTCTTTVVDFLQDWTAMEDRQVFHFFYESLFQDRLTATDVLEAFIKQIILTNPDIPVDHHRVWKLYGPQSGRPHIVQVAQMLFIPLVSRLNKPIFVIDGLDECEQHSRQELIELLPSIITAGSSFFISTRDVSQLTMRFPNIVTIECSINEEGVRLDLETFVSDSIQRQNRKQKITDDEVVLRLIRTTLLEKAKAMFLWAKLLVIDIWTVCNDVTQIKDYLENGLPAGLEETYARCRKRVHPSKVDLSKDLFEIVCGAVEPFYIDELRTILALGEQDGKLIVRRSEPLTDILLRDCGANLIVQSKDGHVLPIHHSVQQYVFPQNQIAERRQTDPGLERVNVELHIGLICMLYLQQRATQTLVKKNTKPSGTVYGTMSAMGFQPYKFLKNIVEKPSTSPKQVAKAPIASEWSYTNNTHSQSLLPYAQRAWVQSNRYLAPQNNPYNKSATSNRSWNLFCHLVSEYREGVTYPWPRFQTFHLHGLFTWAVTHQHRTLIAVLTSPPRVEIARKLGLFNKPLLPPQDGFALHYAATSGQTDLFYNLWHHCDVWKIDNDGNTALHLGAMNGRGDITSHYEFSRILPRRASGPESRQFLCNRRAQNPLHMAIIGKNHACVAYVMKFACFVETQSVKSLNIKGCLSSWILAQDDDGNTSADLAVIHGSHEFIIGFIVTLNMDIHFSQPLNGTDTRVRVTANVARKAIQLQRWDLLKILINRRERLSCPFTPDNPFPHPTLPITQSLLYDIVLYRSDWIPELLSQAWYFEDFALRQAILSFALGNDVLSTRTQDVILLQICQAISPQSKGDFRDAMRQSTEPPRNVNWLSVLLAEAITNHTTEAFDWAIRGARALNPFVIYEAARQGDLRSIKVLLQTNQWRKDTLLQAAKFAVDRCHVEAFLLLRQNNETPPMTKDWLLTIANLESSTRRPDRFSSDIRMQLRSLLSSTSISGSLTDRILWHAAALGLTKLVAQMLNSEDAEINYRGDGGTTALWQAARHGHWETIHELLDCGANAALTDVVARSGVTQKLFWRSPHSNRTPYQVSIIHGTGAPGSVQAKAVERLKLAIDELDSDDLDYNYEASGPPSPDTNLQEDSSAQGPD
ncbi:hypothetical protein K461DRAFT_95141 [Myriangium duriaei CBS 260.36]|uniref:Nephrocystin 3-like N-terminal domain-containing protein n=1 Tax=Myriangium duriaei CBS 260.36 TaxID=1168546 RepID=A0A9P4JCA9_9PEZI|nr:hypothetical protein K461DRAFT_95141 [Myriangium duriaei CBS 260.36]